MENQKFQVFDEFGVDISSVVRVYAINGRPMVLNELGTDITSIVVVRPKTEGGMIAKFHYNIPRHHGKYGTSVSVFASVEDWRQGLPPVARYTTYRFQNPSDGRVCDGEKQEALLRAKVLKNFPNVEKFI